MKTLTALLCIAGCSLVVSGAGRSGDEEEQALRVTSTPPGAHVIINGRDRGVTPFEMKLGKWAFDTHKSTAFSKHLKEPMSMEVRMEGYRTEVVQITRGPLTWKSLNGRNG